MLEECDIFHHETQLTFDKHIVGGACNGCQRMKRQSIENGLYVFQRKNKRRDVIKNWYVRVENEVIKYVDGL